jgi:hypothetical protein
MNQQNSTLNPLTLFLPAELRSLLEAGWQIRGFHKDFSGYGVHLVRGKTERVWRLEAKMGCSVEQPLQHKKDYIFS